MSQGLSYALWAPDLAIPTTIQNTRQDFVGFASMVFDGANANLFCRQPDNSLIFIAYAVQTGINSLSDLTAATLGTTVTSDPYAIPINFKDFRFCVVGVDEGYHLVTFLIDKAGDAKAVNLSDPDRGGRGILVTGSPSAVIWNSSIIFNSYTILIAVRQADSNKLMGFVYDIQADSVTVADYTSMFQGSGQPAVVAGSDPVVVATPDGNVSIIAFDSTKTQLIHVYYSRPMLDVLAPPPFWDRKPVAGGLGPPVFRFPLGGIRRPPLIIPVPSFPNLEVRDQASSAPYTFADGRPAVVARSGGRYSVFVLPIGLGPFSSANGQHLAELTWSPTTPANQMVLTDRTSEADGEPVWQQPLASVDDNGVIHAVATTVSGRLAEYVCPDGQNATVLDRTPIMHNFSTTVIALSTIYYDNNWQYGPATYKIFIAALGYYDPPEPTLKVRNTSPGSVEFSFASNGIIPNYFTGYDLFRIVANSPDGVYQTIFSNYNIGTYIDTGVSPNTSYVYQLWSTTTGTGSGTANTGAWSYGLAVQDVTTPKGKIVNPPTQQVLVPNVVGMYWKSGVNALSALGLNPQIQSGPPVIGSAATAIVSSAILLNGMTAAGQLVNIGTQINLGTALPSTNQTLGYSKVSFWNCNSGVAATIYYLESSTGSWTEIGNLPEQNSSQDPCGSGEAGLTFDFSSGLTYLVVAVSNAPPYNGGSPDSVDVAGLASQVIPVYGLDNGQFSL